MQFRTKELLQKGREAYQGREFKKAKVYFEEVLEVDSRSDEAYFFMANIFHQDGEIGKAIKAFQKVIEINPSHTDASISLSVLYNDIGMYDDAKKYFDQANQRVKSRAGAGTPEDSHINRKFSQKHFELAEMYLSYNRFDEALFEYNKASALDATNLDARQKIAKVYAKKGFVNKALDELKKLRNDHSEFLPARVALGVLYYGTGNVIEAQAEWEKVLTKDPHNSEAQMYLNLSRTASETTI
jgi:tetratricopeptide (TPR) repeat protein